MWTSLTHKKERCSMSDYIFYLADSPVSWSSKWQTVVMTSSMKAEYIDQYNTAQESVWFQTFFKELNYQDLIKKSLTILADNNDTQKLFKDSITHSQAKHMNVKYHWQWYQIECCLLQFNYMLSSENVTDDLTKSLNTQSYNAFKCLIRMDENEAGERMNIDE